MRMPWFKFVWVALLSVLLLVGCFDGGSGGNDTPPVNSGPPLISGSLKGFVISAAGLPLPGAQVTVGGVTATTAADGSYTLADVPASDRVSVQVTLAGYANAFRVAQVLAGETQAVNVARLLSVGVTVDVDPAAGGTVSVPDSPAQVVLPSGGLVPADGGAPAGEVSVSLTPINPANDPELMPGDFTAVSDNSDGTLWAWGQNDTSQLGDGTSSNKNIPTPIPTNSGGSGGGQQESNYDEEYEEEK